MLFNNIISPIESEMIVGSLQYRIAGTIDLYCEFGYKLAIIDWKTNKKIDKEEYYQKCLIFPYLSDNNFVRYSFQQNIYRFLLEKEINKKIELLFLCHLTEDNYKLIRCLNLRKEVKKIMNERDYNK